MLEHKHQLKSLLSLVLTLLLLSLTVLTAVMIQNKIKEGRYIGQDIEVKDTINVSGTGEVYADPDLALISFSVVTEKETVREALEVNKEKMNGVIGKLKDEGVEEKDLKTTTFEINPRYEWHEEDKRGERVLVGYEITQELKVKIRNLKQTGEIIEEATGAGANRVGNIQFTIEDKEELKKEARKQAIKKAKEKAREIASQLGVRIIKASNFSESFYVPRSYSDTMMKAGSIEETPEIEPGQNKVEVNVNVTYEID